MFRMFKMQGHNDWLANLAEGNLYFIIATAYDYAAATKDQKVVLWRTKMSTDSNGVSMDDSVPTLVANSGAYFGKESPPVRLNSARGERRPGGNRKVHDRQKRREPERRTGSSGPR